MIAAIHQPNYLPWLGYFYKICRCDVFVLLDNVQYSKNNIINRNKIKTPQGPIWLTVGVLTKDRHGQLINEVAINNGVPWNKTHYKSLAQNYSKAAYFEKYSPYFERIYESQWLNLADLNETLIRTICQLLGFEHVRFTRASELAASGTETEHLIGICKAVGANTYLSGFGGKKYMDEDSFEKEGIKLEYYDFKHPAYRQLWGDFTPNLSIVDLLFNEGERSLEILKGQSL
jgi:hypothetical protein